MKPVRKTRLLRIRRSPTRATQTIPHVGDAVPLPRSSGQAASTARAAVRLFSIRYMKSLALFARAHGISSHPEDLLHSFALRFFLIHGRAPNLKELRSIFKSPGSGRSKVYRAESNPPSEGPFSGKPLFNEKPAPEFLRTGKEEYVRQLLHIASDLRVEHALLMIERFVENRLRQTGELPTPDEIRERFLRHHSGA